VELVTIMCTSAGPGSAQLAATWQNQYGLQSLVWGDTTDYMYTNFTGPLAGGSYPSSMVVDLDSMTFTKFATGGVDGVGQAVQQILDQDHPCADL